MLMDLTSYCKSHKALFKRVSLLNISNVSHHIFYCIFFFAFLLLLREAMRRTTNQAFSFQIDLVDLISDISLSPTARKSIRKSKIWHKDQLCRLERDFALGSKRWNAFCRT